MTPGRAAENRIVCEASIRLICLPFAGGGSAPFYRWRRHLPAGIALAPITLPGHDGRLNEPPLVELGTLARRLVDESQPMLDRPFVLLGHSVGAWLAFEMARELRRRGRRLPELLVVAANRAPHMRMTESPIHGAPDQEFLNVLGQRYGGIPTEVIVSRELLQLLMPALRADIKMIETYQYVEEQPLDIEILALGGIDDMAVSPAQLDGWRKHTSRACSVRLLPGGHFFLFDSKPSESSAGVRMIVDRIEKFVSGTSANS
jgi:surfactin synthase thioesterase subunit